MTKFDVTGVGNAIVDILAKVGDDFIEKHQLVKSSMQLIDEQRAKALYEDMPPAEEQSGGSAANTLAGIASFGGRAAFIGKVADDDFGRTFRHDIKAIGVHYETPAVKGGLPTSRCLVAVTPDAERTMSTYLGASTGIKNEDVDARLIKDSKVLYLEGYLFGDEQAKKAMTKAAEIARENDTKVSLSLSDPFFVGLFRADFLKFIDKGVDILFANEAEVKSLFETENLDEALAKISKKCDIAAITLGAKGSVIVNGEKRHKIEAGKGLKVVDTTGAGDLYASGFLYGYTQGMVLAECGRLATIAASEVIQHIGARPEESLAKLGRAA